jgi:predicted DNA-binding WGR domain protein
MPDELRSPSKHHLVLHRIDPGQGGRRFYSLMIERDLFGTIRLVRNWDRIGSNGHEKVEIYVTEMEGERRWRRAPGRSGGAAIAISDRQGLALWASSPGSWLNRTRNLSMRRLRSDCTGPSGHRAESWHGEFEQRAKWSFCLRAARMAACRDAGRDDLVRHPGLSRQQDLGPLELAGSMRASAQHSQELSALGLAQFDPVAYVHGKPLCRQRPR